MNGDKPNGPADSAFELIVTGKKRAEIEQSEPTPFPHMLLLDDFFLGDELFDELGQLAEIVETGGDYPGFGNGPVIQTNMQYAFNGRILSL